MTNSALMIFIVVLPWYLINLNIIGLLLMKQDGNIRYHEKIKQALFVLFDNNTENQNKCLIIYRIFIRIFNFILFAVVLMDSIYIVSSVLSKYRITTTYDLINNMAKPCFLEDRAFIAQMLQLHREIDYFIEPDISGCLDVE